ncbi:MAG: TonB-dependent receptor [Sphingomonas sp.]|jgi:iron complex outermembrane receptor protein|uniref:TonB-dependent receptor n=1 Tax=Sphingomonas sp. TaxID=28214 RepID=UPI0035679C44
MTALRKTALLVGVAAIWAVPAAAQVTPENPSTPAQAEGPQVEDIVVTAQRREQSLQKVPISVTAFSAATIEALSAESIGDLDSFTPGLSINDTSVTQPSFAIRGVQTDDFGIGTEPSVGIFVDGIYSGRSGSSLIFFNDIKRVEVLKGPQGTLFGRNTSGGAISIITNKPDDKRALVGTLQVGNYGKVRADATVNIPLTDTLYLRLNGVSNYRKGYLTDALTGEKREGENNKSGRAALRWAPTTDTDFVLAYDHDDTAKDGPFAIGISTHALSTDPAGPFANDAIGDKETRVLNAVSFTATHHAGPLTFTSISSFKHFETHNREDEDGTADPTRYFDTENIEKNSSLYQEFRVGFDNDRLSAIAGVSYFHERGRQTSAATLLTDSLDRILGDAAGFPVFSLLNFYGGLPVFGLEYREDMNNRAANDSYAAFGDATYKLTDRLSLTAGIRYTHDLKRFTWTNGGFVAPGLDAISAPGSLYNAIIGAPLFPDVPISVSDFYRATVGPNGVIFDVGALEGVPFTRRAAFSDVSPRFVVQYDLTGDVHLYASASRGYKAGGFNSTEINSFFEPEKVWNFEGGFKSELFDRRVRFNASAYYFKYKNRQSISLEPNTNPNCQLTPIPPGTVCLPQYVTRSGDSEAYGVDLETQFVVSRDFRVGVTAGLIESKWVTRIEQGVDISGQPTGEPAFRGIVSAHYDHDIGHGSIFADATYSYTSHQRLNDAQRAIDASIAPFVDWSKLGGLRSARNIVNAKVGWRSPGDHVSIAVYAENLLDKRYYRTLNTISTDIFETPYVRADRPGFYGVELGFKF